jgi:predicted HTH transcriptional regulator
MRGDGKQEGLYFELKEKWDGTKVTKAVCCFANAYGGFLIVGATQHPDGRIDSYPGLDPSDGGLYG